MFLLSLNFPFFLNRLVLGLEYIYFLKIEDMVSRNVYLYNLGLEITMFVSLNLVYSKIPKNSAWRYY